MKQALQRKETSLYFPHKKRKERNEKKTLLIKFALNIKPSIHNNFILNLFPVYTFTGIRHNHIYLPKKKTKEASQGNARVSERGKDKFL